MAINLGSAYGKVSLDVKGLLTGVASAKSGINSLHESAVKLGAQMKDVGQKMTIGLTLPILALGAASIKMASDMVETKSKVKVVFGEMTDDVMKWSEGSSKSMQLSQQEALEAAATFGNLFVAMKIGKQDAAEMSTVLVQLAADLGSINNIDPSVVLVKLKSGIVGETEAVRDLGIDLRMIVVEAKAAEMGFKELNGQFSQGDLIAARYAIILEQTKVAQGDIARTGGELAGQMRTLNAQWKDALAILGQNLLPIALKFVTMLNNMLEAFNKMSPFQQKVIIGFLALVAIIGPLLIVFGTLLPMIHLTTRSINPLSGGIFGLVFSLVKLLAVLSIVVKVLAFLGVSTGPVGAGILGLNAAVVGVGGSILAALAPVLFLLLTIAGVIAWWAVAWKINLFYIRDTVASTVRIIKALWGALTAFLRGDTEEAMEFLQAAFDAFGEHVNLIFMKVFGIKDAWAKFFDFMRDALGKTVSFIVKTFTNMDWSLVGKSILSGIANGMLLGLPTLLITAGRVATSVLAEIKKSLGISSPSTEAMKLGAFTAQGFMLGMQTMNPDDIARSLTRPITNNSNSQNQTIVQNFSTGLSLKQVRAMIDTKVDALANELINNLGGA
jgi:hypothetical protein